MLCVVWYGCKDVSDEYAASTMRAESSALMMEIAGRFETFLHQHHSYNPQKIIPSFSAARGTAQQWRSVFLQETIVNSVEIPTRCSFVMEFIIPKFCFIKAQYVSSGAPLIIRSPKLYLQPLV
jgi:hypothetical protein